MDESYTNGYNEGFADAENDYKHSINNLLYEILKYNGDTTKVESIINQYLRDIK